MPASTEKAAGENHSRRYLPRETLKDNSNAKKAFRRIRSLFCGVKDGVHSAPISQARINICAALSAVKLGAAGALHAGSGFRALRRSRINLGRINIIADAMYHKRHMG